MFLVLVSSITAVKPSPTTQISSPTIGLIIEDPQIKQVEHGEAVGFRIHVFNVTDGAFMSNKTVRCWFHLYNQSKHIQEQEVTKFGHDFDWEIDINSTTLSEYGYHPYIIQCNTTFGGGFVSDSLLVIPQKQNLFSDSLNATPLIMVIVFFMFWLIISLLVFYHAESMILKITSGLFIFFFTMTTMMFLFLMSQELGFMTFVNLLMPYYQSSILLIRFSFLAACLFLVYYSINMFFNKKDKGTNLDKEFGEI